MRFYTHALVLGLGCSGEGAVRLLLSEGTQVTAVDSGRTPELIARARKLESEGAGIVLGAKHLPINGFDACVISPGIPADGDWAKEVRSRGTPLIGELELGWGRCRGPLVAVTGSNGKSTVVKWLWQALWRPGRPSRIAGNYGWPLSRAVLESPDANPWIVEVSSFQLETINEFRPDVAILLNVHPNHLDRHGDMDTYLAAKARVFANTRETDTCIVPFELSDRLREMSGGAGRWFTFGTTPDADYTWENGRVLSNGETRARLEGTLFDNDVMGPSAAAVVAALACFGVDGEDAVASLQNMDPLPHRMQTVRVRDGVTFVDDSKATNLAAMQAGLRMAAGPVRLIAGGLAKEKDFDSAKEVLAERAASIYLIGQSAEDMASAWSDVVPCHQCGTLDEAVAQAVRDARSGETILLSPGCASFDQFRNFEERGGCFARIVKNLAEEELKWETECHGVR
jgi:UDP-N-acetylmuramoylalanine--D-glutamate ligase